MATTGQLKKRTRSIQDILKESANFRAGLQLQVDRRRQLMASSSHATGVRSVAWNL
jgi:hypothetical protein